MNNFESEKSDLRHRESKRKIFGQQARSKIEEKSPIDNSIPVKKPSAIQSDINCGLNDLLKKQIDQLSNSNKELKQLLLEERQKYENLFQQYEQLVQRNSLIEKQYINLKYEHSKQIKNIKKNFVQKIGEFLGRSIDVFSQSIQEEVLWEGIKSKIQKFITQLKNYPDAIANSKIKKPTRQGKEIYLQKFKSTIKSQNEDLEVKTQKSSITEAVQAPTEFKISESPLKQQKQENKQHKQMSNQKQKQIVFEDEYYGNLEDYNQYEQKILQRKNYQLLKNCNRNGQNRRKKIFNINEPSQLIKNDQ